MLDYSFNPVNNVQKIRNTKRETAPGGMIAETQQHQTYVWASMVCSGIGYKQLDKKVFFLQYLLQIGDFLFLVEHIKSTPRDSGDNSWRTKLSDCIATACELP